jgi:Pyruvate/2-oxoacid:ferredoxin oxidoreductase gamma subunit
LLGAFAAMTHLLDMGAVERAIQEKLPGKIGEMNVTAARAAFAAVAEGDGSGRQTAGDP